MIKDIIEFIEVFFVRCVPGLMLMGWVVLMFDHFLKGVFSYWLLVMLFPLIGWYKVSQAHND